MSIDCSGRSDRQIARQVLDSYGAWVADQIAEGYTGYLITFMFKPLPASGQIERIKLMHQDVERVYGRLVRRFARHPRKPSERSMLPTLICAPDLPVFKRMKMAMADVAVNDGLHTHGILLRPPVSRFKGALEGWVYEKHHRLVEETYLRRIHIVALNRTPEYATQYALKALGGRIEMDSLLLLPKALSELLDPTARGYDMAVCMEGGASLLNRGGMRW